MTPPTTRATISPKVTVGAYAPHGDESALVCRWEWGSSAGRGGEVGRWFGVTGAADGLSPVGFPLGACVPSRLGVNLPSGPLSNRACGSPAHGFPTPFIVRHAQSPICGRFR